MKQLLFIILAAIMFVGCMSEPIKIPVTSADIDDEVIVDFLNKKMPNAQKVSDVEVISEDSVLSFSLMITMEIHCAKLRAEGKNPDKTIMELNDYFYDVVVVRTAMRTNTPRQEDLTEKHHGDWRRLLNVKAKREDGSTDNFEVIFDSDGKTPYMTGQDYDLKVSEWDSKIQTLY